MTILLQIACRTIKRRLDAGEAFDDVVKEYPKITVDQISEIKKELEINE